MHDPRDFFLLPHHPDASVVDRKEIVLPLSGKLTEEEFPGNAWRRVCVFGAGETLNFIKCIRNTNAE